MSQGFWAKLKKPIMVMAPMADVTDAAFRQIIAKYGKPDVLWTEFVSADGLFMGGKDALTSPYLSDSKLAKMNMEKGEGGRGNGSFPVEESRVEPVENREVLKIKPSVLPGREALLRDLMFTEGERPIVAQFFTARPENMKRAAVLARELGFDGIDINMGCPDKGIERQGAGAAMIKNPKVAREVLAAAIEGAGGLPVSVKTRIGFNKNELETWLPELLKENPAVVTIHARTRKEMSKVPADWTQVKRAVEIRNAQGSETLIFGNGDVTDLAHAQKRVGETGCDGVMLGRAIFGNPWLFNPYKNVTTIPLDEKLRVMVEHTYLFEKLLGEHKNFAIMKKHYKAYVNGWDGAKELRMKLMDAPTAKAVEEIVNEYLRSLKNT